MEEQQFIKGRGAQINPKNRFQQQSYAQSEFEQEDDWESFKNKKTTYLFDNSKTVVNKVTSPDVGMLYSLNPYQGCEHGCVYCYARNSHEYWGFSAGHDFESKIVVKQNAPELLRKMFDKKSWTPAVISLSGNTDCYQPIERKMRITRELLKVCLEYKNPVGILTKNALVLRDLDILQDLAKENLMQVNTSITTTDETVRQLLEPRTSTYATRLKIVETCAKNNIPTGVMFAPIIPGINDSEMFAVLQSVAGAGAYWAGYTIVRLNGAIASIFKDWLYKSFPDRATKVWHHIESCHGGVVSDFRAGTRIKGEGNFSEIIQQQFKLYCKKLGLNEQRFEYNLSSFKRASQHGQLELF